MSFGPGSAESVGQLIGRRNAKRVLLISDPVLEATGLIKGVQDLLAGSDLEVSTFLEGEVEPGTATVRKVVEQANDFQPDVFVAVGGGSNMDLAKGVVATLSTKCEPEELFGFDLVAGPTPTLICMPTTGGTGSEVSHAAVIKDSSTDKKGAILSQHIRPEIAIVDPYLTVSCPAKVSAESGIDALTHAIEAFLVTNFYAFNEDSQHGLPYEGNHPLGDMYAREAIRLIGANLKNAVEKGDQLAPRTAMSFAATLAGAAFSSCGVSLCHALEYGIGSHLKCSHGAGNGILLTEVMRFWLSSRQKRLAEVAQLLGVPDAGRMTEEEAAMAAIEFVEQLRADVGLPRKLSDVGGDEGLVEPLAENAIGMQRLIDLSPNTPEIDDLKSILRRCV